MPLPDLAARWLARADELAPYAPAAAEAFRRAAAELEAESADAPASVAEVPVVQSAATWRERIWTAPADTRMTVADVAEAAARPKSWVYRHTSPASGLPRIPHRKLDGELVFAAGEVREWIRAHEDVVVKPLNLTPFDRARRGSANLTTRPA